MAAQPLEKQLWIGLVEVRALDGGSKVLDGAKGAFVNIVTWASDAQEYEHNARLVIEHLGGLFVSEVIRPEPVETRRTKQGRRFDEDIEDMISRAEGNSNAIIYGTFHTFENDDA